MTMQFLADSIKEDFLESRSTYQGRRCSEKYSYPSLAKAERQAKIVREKIKSKRKGQQGRRKLHVMKPYRCPVCDRYHLTKDSSK